MRALCDHRLMDGGEFARNSRCFLFALPNDATVLIQGTDGSTRGVCGDGPMGKHFDTPEALAISAHEMYIADETSSNIVVFDLAGVFRRRWGSRGTAHGQFDFGPKALAVLGDLVLAADAGAEGEGRIQAFHASGLFIWQIAPGLQVQSLAVSEETILAMLDDNSFSIPDKDGTLLTQVRTVLDEDWPKKLAVSDRGNIVVVGRQMCETMSPAWTNWRSHVSLFNVLFDDETFPV
jgi:hypothetical protein